MGAVEEYRARREARIAQKKIRMDAPDSESNNNQSSGGSGGSGGSHGNTRLPFGLCMRYGITIEPSWGPGDAWAALKDKGISASGAYGKLKAGGDPGTPEAAPPKKDPVRSIRVKHYGDTEYNKMYGKKISWASRGDDPWRLYADRVEGTGDGSYAPRRMSESFRTKTDMLRWLKKEGVEEFTDPETGEKVNPKEMDLPEAVFSRGHTGYSAMSVGYRDGKYALICTDFDGKKKTLRDFPSLRDAKDYVEYYGGKLDDLKMSPAIKKREAERTAWLSSDKKEYFEDGGKKFGDIHIGRTASDFWKITGEAEDGEKDEVYFKTKAELMSYLKDRKVEVAREGKETVNPMEYEVPETKFVIRDRKYQDASIDVDRYGYLGFSGKDLDGEKVGFTYRRPTETMGEFKERLKKDYGVDFEKLTISDESRKRIEEIEQEFAEKEKRRLEFEAKATTLTTGKKFADIEVEKDDWDGKYKITGYDVNGEKRDITYSGDFYDMENKAKEYGLDFNSLVKNEGIRKEYEEYLDKRKEFDNKAVDIAGDKYADVHSIYGRYGYQLVGTDWRGREREIGSADSYTEYENLLNQYGHTPDSFPMDDRMKEAKEKALKVRYALATGEYYSMGETDKAFKDIRIKESKDTPGYWEVSGTDVDGNRETLYELTWDGAQETMEKYGVNNYKLEDKDGNEMRRPTYGMRHVIMMRKEGGGFVVLADTKRYGKGQIMYEGINEKETRQWLKDNGVPESTIKTRGMNPNDDVPRTHTAKSLDNFDTHRMEKAEEWEMLNDMDEGTKKETAEMLTDMFNQGAYRINRTDHFAEIVNGKFKNLLETGTSRGSSYKEGRRETGVKTFGHPRDIKPSDAENYGYFGLEDDKESIQHPTAGGYGGIQFKFNKDKVNDRVTYTFGDTLDSGRPLAGYAGKYPTIEGVTGLDEYGGGADKLRGILEDYRSYKKGDMSFSDFHRILSRTCQDGYVECQFHGPLTINDVESITMKANTFDRTFNGMTAKQRKDVVTKLKNAGIIFQYEENGHLHDAYERFKRLYGGEGE